MEHWQIEINRLVDQGWDIKAATNYVKRMCNDRWTLDTFLESQQEMTEFILVTKMKKEPTKENINELLIKDQAALFVEVGEYVQADEGFKYWRVPKEKPREKILSELVDVFATWCNNINHYEFTPQEIEEAYKKKYKENLERAKGEY